MEERGKIKNRMRAQQIRDFSGLQFGKITPTDIDGLIDFGNVGFVLIETKLTNAEFPYGQRLAVERVVDNLAFANKDAIGIVAEHDTTPEEDIDVANCRVIEYRHNNSWLTPRNPHTVREFIDNFLDILAKN